jgi:hypothetical protein
MPIGRDCIGNVRHPLNVIRNAEVPEITCGKLSIGPQNEHPFSLHADGAWRRSGWRPVHQRLLVLLYRLVSDHEGDK